MDIIIGQTTETITGHTKWVRSLTVLQDGNFASGRNDRKNRILDTIIGHTTKTLRDHTKWVRALTVF